MSVEINNYKEKHSNEIINFDKQNSLEISNELKDIDKSKNVNINKINIDNNKDDENNIINNNDFNKNDIIQEKNDAENIVTYQETCTNCKASPLYDVFYYCTRCSITYCSKCESERGSIHIHPLYKIQSFDQYMNSDIKLKEKFNNKIEEYRSNFKDFIGGLNNMVNNNIELSKSQEEEFKQYQREKAQLNNYQENIEMNEEQLKQKQREEAEAEYLKSVKKYEEIIQDNPEQRFKLPPPPFGINNMQMKNKMSMESQMQGAEVGYINKMNQVSENPYSIDKYNLGESNLSQNPILHPVNSYQFDFRRLYNPLTNKNN